MATRIGLSRFEQRMNVRMDAAGLLGKIVFWFVFLVFLVPAVDTLGLTTVSNLLHSYHWGAGSGLRAGIWARRTRICSEVAGTRRKYVK